MTLPLLWLLMNAAWRPALGLAVIAGLSQLDVVTAEGEQVHASAGDRNPSRR